MANILDRVSLNDDLRLTDEGYLHVSAPVARTGIQLYNPGEIGMVGDSPVRVYRPETSVFAKDSLASFAGIPITIGHPKEMVDSTKAKELSVGFSGEEVLRDGEHLKIGLKITDKAAVDLVKAGIRDLSVGYTCMMDETPGTAPDGQAYDAIQRDIKANHIAIVPEGRAGSARIGDGDPWGAAPLNLRNWRPHMADNLTTVVAFDEAYSVNDDGVKMHKRFQTALDEANEENKQMGDKIAELEAKSVASNDQIAELEKQVSDNAITPAKLKAAAASRQATMDAAKKLGLTDKDMEDMDEDEMKSAAVKKKMGDKAEAYDASQIGTAFDALSAAVVPTKDGLGGGDVQSTTPVGDELAKAYDERNVALMDAWKTKKEAS